LRIPVQRCHLIQAKAAIHILEDVTDVRRPKLDSVAKRLVKPYFTTQFLQLFDDADRNNSAGAEMLLADTNSISDVNQAIRITSSITVSSCPKAACALFTKLERSASAKKVKHCV
jgi:hypothetical protein